jgi:hypothetical protein
MYDGSDAPEQCVRAAVIVSRWIVINCYAAFGSKHRLELHPLQTPVDAALTIPSRWFPRRRLSLPEAPTLHAAILYTYSRVSRPGWYKGKTDFIIGDGSVFGFNSGASDVYPKPPKVLDVPGEAAHGGCGFGF